MNKFLTVLGHTYVSKLKSKAFIISTVIVLLVLVGIGNIDKVIEMFDKDKIEKVAVIDDSNEIFSSLKETLEHQNEHVHLTSFSQSVEEGKEAVEVEEFRGLLVIETEDSQLPKAVFYENEANSDLASILQDQLQRIKVAIATEQAGIDAETMETIYEEMEFDAIALDKTAKTEEELSSTRGIVYVMLIVLYMTVLIYGQMIATEVATEKSSRVMEILISSASPITHMFAKIIGVGLLGLTQILIFIVAGYLLIVSKVNEYASGFFEVFGFSNISNGIYVYAVIFFLLGYFLYATIAAMLGSIVSRVEDVQQLIMPLVFLVMIGFFIAIFGLGSPGATFVTVTSFIPFFSPMMMFLRVGMIDVPIWQVIVSIGILLGTIYLFALVGSRIYRGGVLMYGSSKSLKDLKNAFLLSKNEK